jgi:hypothetical protein
VQSLRQVREDRLTALVDAAVLARFGLNPKDERYTLPSTKAWALSKMQLERFTLDVCGCPESHLAPRWYGLQLDGSFIDGLDRPWDGDVWANIPFSRFEHWLVRAWSEWRRGRVRTISLLVPNDKTEQPPWQTWVAPYRDRRGSPLRAFEHAGRARFSAPGLGGKAIPSHGSKHGSGSPFFGCYLLGWHRRFLRGAP